MEENNTYYNKLDELDQELAIDLKKIFYSIWMRKKLIISTFIAILFFFILMTFISAKVYTVNSDLYVQIFNKTNLAEANPFFIENGGTGTIQIGSTNVTIMNEIELIKSPLVIDKVIRDNNLVYKKLYGIIPTKKTGQYLSTAAFLKKNIKIDNKKNTNVITISYKSKKPQVAYNVVQSIIFYYMDLHKQINEKKSKSDISLLEKEYNSAKANLDAKLKQSNGLPTNSLNNSANIAVMSAYSKSAQSALSNIKGQYLEGERSEIAIKEEAQKVSELSSRLEWAKMVDALSSTSKVLVLAEPVQPKPYEQTSPKLFTNILLGIVFGVIGALFTLIYVENINKKLTYSMLGEKIIYNLQDNFNDLKLILLSNQDKRILFAAFDNLPQSVLSQLQEFKNISMIQADVTNDFVDKVSSSDLIMIIAKIDETDSKLYKQVKTIIKDLNKNVEKEILV